MKYVNKVAATLIAVSLLSATPAWAKSEHHEQAKKDVLTAKQTWEQMVKQAEEKAKKVKAKSVSVKKLPAEMKRVLDKYIAIFPALKDLKLESAGIESRDSYNGAETWNFYLTNNKRNDDRVRADFTVNADSGYLVEFDMNYNVDDDEHDKPISYDEGEKIAEELLSELFGSTEAKKYKAIKSEDDKDAEDRYGNLRVMKYQRYINNVPLEGALFRIVIDPDGQIVEVENDFSHKIKDSGISKPKKLLSESEAKDKFTDLLDMSLLYDKTQVIEIDRSEKDEDEDYASRRKTKPVLKYEPAYNGPIDAAKGDIPADLDLWKDNKDLGKVISIHPKGKQLKIYSLADAEAFVRDILGIDLSKYELEDNDVEDGYYSWEIIDEEKGLPEYIEIEVDEHGNLEDLWIDEYSSNDNTKVTQGQAIEKAVSIAENFADAKTDKLQITDISTPDETPDLPSWVDKDEIDLERFKNDSYTINFSEIYQGVPVADESISVQVNAETGLIEGLNINNSELDNSVLPDNKDTVSKNKAAKAYLNEGPLELTYVWPELVGYRAPKPVLVYKTTLTSEGYVDALTGEYVKIKINEDK